MASKMMQAIQVYQYGGPEELKIENIPCPEPKGGEVLIRVEAAGVLPIDWKIRRGLTKNIFPVHFPYIPGSAFSGVVEKQGPGVTDFQIGQFVFGRAKGTYTEYTISSVDELIPMPENLTFTEAATITGGAAAAYNALFNEGELVSGQKVLIHGAAGGVGSFATQFAHWKGANVIGTASTKNVDFIRLLGADNVVDYNKTQFEKVVKDVDLVLDTVGGDTLQRSLSIIKPGGTLISLVEQPPIDKAKELGINAKKNSSLASKEDLRAIADLIAQKKIKAIADKIFTLNEVQHAHSVSETGHGRGRIVLQIADTLSR
ncbi:NADP-dependent oxidoreductase [Neobacillus sp. NPDC058068]|uniref:NADP-dependent oxidoreductase n=1 Tax=Neobacillus sp. NPDC058068 TaxID=3346325 RepID=UPI0036DDBD48